MAKGSTQPFHAAATAMAACAGEAVTVALAPASGDSVLVYNTSASIAFVRFCGGGAATVDPALDIPIPPGASRLLGISPLVTQAAVCVGATGTGTGNVYLSRGDGTVY